MGGHRKRYGMLVLALSTFARIGNSLVHDGINNISHCYQARALEYEDYLDRNLTKQITTLALWRKYIYPRNQITSAIT